MSGVPFVYVWGKLYLTEPTKTMNWQQSIRSHLEVLQQSNLPKLAPALLETRLLPVARRTLTLESVELVTFPPRPAIYSQAHVE